LQIVLFADRNFADRFIKCKLNTYLNANQLSHWCSGKAATRRTP